MLLTCALVAGTMHIAVPDANPQRMIALDHVQAEVTSTTITVRDPDTQTDWMFALHPRVRGASLPIILDRCASEARARTHAQP